MKKFFITLLLLCCGLTVFTQDKSELQKMVDTEHSFAAFASEHDTKSAFLQFLAPDGVLFQPDKVNGLEYWNTRGPSKGLLSWEPNYADISTNGILGYTTGNWEYRPKGKDDVPTGFGDFVTLWLRQPDGKYKVVVDIGFSHAKPDKYSSEWVTSQDKIKDPNAKGLSASYAMNGFYELATKQSLRKAYETYAADDIRLFREGKLPFIGKKPAIKGAAADKGIMVIAKRSTFFGATDLSYTTRAYTRTDAGKIIEKGNYMQIWKLKAGKWVIVLDIFAPISEK